MLPTLGSDDVSKIRTLIGEAVKVKTEISDLSTGLRDTIKAVCEEMSIPVATLNKAVKMEMANNQDEMTEELSDAGDLKEIYNNKNLKNFG